MIGTELFGNTTRLLSILLLSEAIPCSRYEFSSVLLECRYFVRHLDFLVQRRNWQASGLADDLEEVVLERQHVPLLVF